MDHIGEGKHGARSTKQAIAIGLSKARRAGVRLPPPGKGRASAPTRQAERDIRKGQSSSRKKTSAERSRATSNALKLKAIGRHRHGPWQKHAQQAARKRSSSSRSQAPK